MGAATAHGEVIHGPADTPIWLDERSEDRVRSSKPGLGRASVSASGEKVTT